MAGACDVHRCMEEKPETQAARVGKIGGRPSRVLQIGRLQGRLSGMCDHNPTWALRILVAHGRGARDVVTYGGKCGYCWRLSS